MLLVSDIFHLFVFQQLSPLEHLTDLVFIFHLEHVLLDVLDHLLG